MLEIKNKKISELKPASYNPRDINDSAFEGLKESLKKFGMPQPIIVNKRTGNICGGHQRLKAAGALGWETVPTIEIDISLKEEKALNVTLNNQKISGHFTSELDALLKEIRLDNGDDYFKSLKLDEIEIPPLPEEIQAQENERADSVPEVAQNELGVALGDIYQLGEHRLMCGDSTDLQTVEKLMDGQKADMVFTSPPYNGDNKIKVYKNDKYGSKLYKDESMDNKTSGEYISFLKKTFSSIKLAIKDSANILFNISYNLKSRSEYIRGISNAIEDGFLLKETIVWKKKGMPLTKWLTRDFEFIFLLSKNEGDYFINQKNNETISNVWDISNSGAQYEDHNACFPIALPVKGLEIFSEKGCVCFEPFCGSGSTLIACEKTNRKCYSMELDPHYCSVIIKRWEIFTGKKAVKLNG